MSQSAPPRDSGALPSLRTRLYGREGDRDAGVQFLLAEAVPLLTVTGPGGVGKTSLALAIAHHVKSSFADGMAWVDLTPVSDPEHVLSRIASALGINLAGEGRAAAVGAILGSLRTRQSLLLLDNCEHVAASVGELLADLLLACPALQVLATSRVPINIRYEQRLRVEPLSIPHASQTSVDSLRAVASVQLFLDRARARQPRLLFDTSTAPSIAALCRHLEGMPLAIELAATQINVFSPDALLATVQTGNASQPVPLNDLPERQRSITATIAWSYGLLSPDGQVLFRNLSVFANGCTLEAAQAVTGWDPVRSARAMHELVDANLIASAQHTPEPRFTMLESMRTFALTRLQELGEEHSARQVHAAHFTNYFARSYPEVLGPNGFPWLQRFNLEFDNVRAAFAWFFSQDDGLGAMRLLAAADEYWSARRHRSEARAWAEAALARAPDAPAALRSTVLHIATFATRSLGDFPAAIALAEQGLAAAQESGDLIAIGRAYYQLGNAWHHIDPVRAVEACTSALKTFREIDDPGWLAVILADLGDKLRDCDKLDAAIPLLDEGLALSRAVPYPWGIAQALGQRAHAALVQCELEDAAAYFAESIPLAQQIGDEHMVMGAVVGLAGVALFRNHPVAAAILLAAVDAEQHATRWPRVSHPIPAARIRQSVADALPADVWESALAAGRLLPFAEAVSAAIAIADHDDDATRRLELHILPPVQDSGDPETMPESPSDRNGSRDSSELSWRELEVLTLLCQRSTNAEMAQLLFVSPRTIESHVSHILEKLQVRNRREAAAIAVKRGLISLPQP
jgi:predicted ATPase/DNA-binding CsgD family transcriptional regulator